MKKIINYLVDKWGMICENTTCRLRKQLKSADMAQSVERRLGKAEVTGSIPVISLG